MPYRTRARTDVCPACDRITRHCCSHCHAPLCSWHSWLQCSEACVLHQLRVRKRYRHAGDPGGDVLRPVIGHEAPRQTQERAEAAPLGLIDWISLACFVVGGLVLLSMLLVNCGM